MSKARTVLAKGIVGARKSARSAQLPPWYALAAYLFSAFVLVSIAVPYFSSDENFSATNPENSVYTQPQVIPVTPSFASREEDYVAVGDARAPRKAVETAQAVVYALFTGNGGDVQMYGDSVFPASFEVYPDPQVVGPVAVTVGEPGYYTFFFEVDPDASGPKYAVSQSILLVNQEGVWSYSP
ncbi:MAG: hypothetical protein FJ167_09550 [Gammaproteobacteria bacterium]|nr:hypothetical protein [Gammaproteobacteria bacterium]